MTSIQPQLTSIVTVHRVTNNAATTTPTKPTTPTTPTTPASTHSVQPSVLIAVDGDDDDTSSNPFGEGAAPGANSAGGGSSAGAGSSVGAGGSANGKQKAAAVRALHSPVAEMSDRSNVALADIEEYVDVHRAKKMHFGDLKLKAPWGSMRIIRKPRSEGLPFPLNIAPVRTPYSVLHYSDLDRSIYLIPFFRLHQQPSYH